MLDAPMPVMLTRIGLILLGMLVIYLGKKGTLEPLLMIPMGLGMIAVNAGVLLLDPVTSNHVRQAGEVAERLPGTLVNAPLVPNDSLLYMLQVDFLQPVYTFTFSNGLIACLVFMGIGVLLDVGYLLQRPLQSMFLALCAELGTILVFPIGVSMGMTPGESASIAMVGGADGPMVLFTSLMCAKDIFVPITVIAYLYLGLTYGLYPMLIKLLVPKHIRATPMPKEKMPQVSSGAKLAFAVVSCTLLCLLFPVAAPLFLSLFLGVAIREAGLDSYIKLLDGPILYGATLMLGLVLGVLCEASTILNPVVLKLLVLGVLALLISAIGGLIGGYVLYFITGKKYNPVIGIAAVSCVPTTVKVAQKSVSEVAPNVLVVPHALGANISGVITSAIICALYVLVVKGG